MDNEQSPKESVADEEHAKAVVERSILSDLVSRIYQECQACAGTPEIDKISAMVEKTIERVAFFRSASQSQDRLGGETKNEGRPLLYTEIMASVQKELLSAEDKFGPFNTPHEGYAVILEELDELWDEIKRKDRTLSAMREEAIQVAAMAIRFIKNCCPSKE